jgi:hypothetical protein
VVLFLLSVDGGEPCYPDEFADDRKEKIKWDLAENYLPAPASTWEKDHIEINVRHFGRRLLHDKAGVIYTRVELKNTDTQPHQLKLIVNGNKVSERTLELGDDKMRKDRKSVV